MNKAKLRDLLVESFNSSELHNLCFDLDIKHESIAGNTIDDKAREIIDYCIRRGKHNELINRCNELRPHVNWSNFLIDKAPSDSSKISREKIPQFNSPNDIQNSTDPIKITRIIIEDVTQPRNDGTRGSALYEIPLQLSRRPSRVWSDLFVETWNRPPRYTTMHRPGIAEVIGDRIILNGTTMQEIEDYHLDTLKLVIERVNIRFLEVEKANQKREEEKQKRRQEHKNEVKDINDRLKFD